MNEPPHSRSGSSPMGRQARIVVPSAASAQPPADDDDVAWAMSSARIGDELDEARAMSSVKRGLFDDAEITHAPMMLSRYVLLECIGLGGLGVVYAAYDPSLDRRIAIKLLQQRAIGDENEQVARERLALEAQALAQLAHPNVVAIHDVGTYTLDRPLGGAQPQGVFLVMEFVDGEDLGLWARARPRTWREVTAMVLAAGRGLEAAHRAGIVHGDFKPGNVLVGRDGRARVVDFGLAHGHAAKPSSTPTPSTDAPRTSRRGTDARGEIGTPAYMAPEQHDGQAADARSDQFAYCVALWEALFGRGPFAAGDLHTLRALKRGGIVTPPPRSRVPRRIIAALRKGLSPSPADRHVDMAALLAVIETSARRRGRRAAMTLGLVTTAMAGTLWLTRREASLCTEFEAVAKQVWNDDVRAEIAGTFAASGRAYGPPSADAVAVALDEYTQAWVARRRDSCEAVFVRQVRSPEAMHRVATCLDANLARADQLIRLLREADASTVDQAVEAVDALPALSKCDHFDDQGTAASSAVGRALGQSLSRAEALLDAAHPAESLTAAEAVRNEAERNDLVGLRGEAELLVGRAHLQAGRLDEANASLWSALSSAERTGDESMAARALLELTTVAIDAALPLEAEHHIALVQAKLARHDLGGAIAFGAHYQRAKLARLRGDGDATVAAARLALEHAELVFAPGHFAIARARTLLGVTLSDRGDLDLARAEYEAAKASYEARLGPEHPSVAIVVDLLASQDAQAGRYREALAQHRAALAIRERAFGPVHPDVAYSLANIATVEESLGDLDAAMKDGRRARDILVAARGEDDPEAAAVMSNLANVMLDLGAFAEALATADGAEAILARTVGPEHPRTAFAIATAGIALTLLERFDEALEHLERARRILVTRLGPDGTAVPIIDKAIAEAEFGAGHLERAAEICDRAIAAMLVHPHDPRDLVGAQILAAILRTPSGHEEGDPAVAALREPWRATGRGDADFDALTASLTHTLQRTRARLGDPRGP